MFSNVQSKSFTPIGKSWFDLRPISQHSFRYWRLNFHSKDAEDAPSNAKLKDLMFLRARSLYLRMQPLLFKFAMF